MMNSQDMRGDPHDTGPAGDDNTLSDALRWQLRDLRRDQAPARDLWPDIAARLTPPRRASRTYIPRQWALPALAATLVLALGFIGWEQGLIRDPPSTSPPLAATPGATLSPVQREAAGLTVQYQAALVEIGGVSPNATLALQPAFDELDRNARLILDALARDPDSRLLLQQLRRTYSHRLALAQRLAIS